MQDASLVYVAGAMLAALVLGAGLFWRRARRGGGAPGPVLAGPEQLLARMLDQRLVLDIQPGPEGEPFARCLPTQTSPVGLSCELVDSAAAGEVRIGREVMCFFPPQRLADGARVNAFATEILAVALTAEPPQLLLRTPAQFVHHSRRRIPRMRVRDPHFVRVRLWAADFLASSAYFPDTTPDIWINAYDGRQSGDENAVMNISAGGLALQVRSALVPRGLGLGSPVVLKCSLFQFREKLFKPYWYAGVVKALGSTGPRTRRIAIAFTAAGALDEQSPQGVRWTEIIPQTANGGIA